MVKIVLEGGPVPGAPVDGVDSGALQVRGDEHGQPGMVATYRRTRRRDGDRVIYAFKGWAKVLATIPMPGATA